MTQAQPNPRTSELDQLGEVFNGLKVAELQIQEILRAGKKPSVDQLTRLQLMLDQLRGTLYLMTK